MCEGDVGYRGGMTSGLAPLLVTSTGVNFGVGGCCTHTYASYLSLRYDGKKAIPVPVVEVKKRKKKMYLPFFRRLSTAPLHPTISRPNSVCPATRSASRSTPIVRMRGSPRFPWAVHDISLFSSEFGDVCTVCCFWSVSTQRCAVCGAAPEERVPPQTAGLPV